jgi:integrase/recombinase XerD
MVVGAGHHFEVAGLTRRHWSSAAPVRAIFRDAFEAAGLPYFNPHSLRNTLVQLGERHCRTPEDFKAWSQNLGHEEVMTTFYSYGQVGMRRQGEIIHGLAEPRRAERGNVEKIVEAVVRGLRESGAVG